VEEIKRYGDESSFVDVKNAFQIGNYPLLRFCKAQPGAKTFYPGRYGFRNVASFSPFGSSSVE
jgi:hypothetical protein